MWRWLSCRDGFHAEAASAGVVVAAHMTSPKRASSSSGSPSRVSAFRMQPLPTRSKKMSGAHANFFFTSTVPLSTSTQYSPVAVSLVAIIEPSGTTRGDQRDDSAACTSGGQLPKSQYRESTSGVSACSHSLTLLRWPSRERGTLP